MRKLGLAVVIAAVMGIPLASASRADETTVIKKAPSDTTTIVKKREGVQVFPIPHPEEHTTIIKKHDDDDQ